MLWASLVFPQKAPGSSADDHYRDFFFVRFHVDTGAVSGVAFYKNLSTTHGVPRRVTDIDEILSAPFTVVTPDSKDPYRQMYVAN